MVQMLNTLFDGRTQCVRRMHSLANSIIIFDEIQSLPVKCIHIFNLTINFLSYVCGATVILCSATQPLLDRKVQYKILLGKPPSIMRNIEEVYQNFKRVEVKNLIKADKYDADDLTELIMKIMENSDNVLTIMNTKGAARRLYNTVKERVSRSNDNENIIMMLLTTHMCPKHRLHLINDMRDKLGKEKIICISTSLIEAGVDISFDNVIRSLTGLDSIAQAAGRCNRNGIGKTGTVYIINSKDEDLSKLPEIKTAQNATSLILENYKNDPEYFKNDLFSPFTLELFYKKYFYEIRNEMNYRIRDKNTNLLDLLSDNTSGVRAYKTNNQEYPQMLLNQAFKTAGEEFEVIVNQAQSVIVPYNEEAKQLIAILEGNSEMDAIKMALRKVQVYTVNLYQNEFIILDKLGGITALKNVNIFVLTEGFYSNETGITKDTNLDFLLI